MSSISRNLVATFGTALFCVLLIHLNPSPYLSLVLLTIAGSVPVLVQRPQSWAWVLALSVLVVTGTVLSSRFFQFNSIFSQLSPNNDPWGRVFVMLLSPLFIFLGGVIGWFVVKKR